MTLAVNDSSFNLHFTYLERSEEVESRTVNCHKLAVQVVAEVFSATRTIALAVG